MKKAIVCIMTFIVLLSATGCERATQIDERAIIELAGIDLDNGKYNVTVQMFAPNGEQIADAGNIYVNTVTASGYSIGEAMQNIELTQGRKPFLGHTYVLVLGESLQNADIESVLRVFAGYPDIYPGMNVIMSKGSAYDIVSMKIPMGMISARTMSKVIVSGENSAVGRKADLAQSITALNGIEKAVSFPLVETVEATGETDSEISDDEDGNVLMIQMGQTAVLSDKGMVAVLDTDGTKALNWLTGNIRNAYYTVNVDSRDVQVKVVKGKTTIRPYTDGSTVVMKTKISALIKSVDKVDSTSYDKAYYDEVSKQVASQIKEQCLETSRRLIDSRCDVLGIGKRLSVTKPGLMREYTDSSYMKNIRYEIDVICKADK